MPRSQASAAAEQARNRKQGRKQGRKDAIRDMNRLSGALGFSPQRAEDFGAVPERYAALVEACGSEQSSVLEQARQKWESSGGARLAPPAKARKVDRSSIAKRPSVISMRSATALASRPCPSRTLHQCRNGS